MPLGFFVMCIVRGLFWLKRPLNILWLLCDVCVRSSSTLIIEYANSLPSRYGLIQLSDQSIQYDSIS